MRLDRNSHRFHFTSPSDPFYLIDLDDDEGMQDMFNENDKNVHVHLMPLTNVEDPKVPRNQVTPNRCSSNSIQPYCSNNMEAFIDSSTQYSINESNGLSRRCAERESPILQSSQWKNAIMGSGQTFQSAAEFRNALYLMSIAGRFKYGFKRNYPKHMSVFCKVDGCPWKVTCRSIGDSNIVRIHTFNNIHNHSIHDVSFNEPELKAKHAAVVIDNVIRSTPDYLPRQICKDFLREHGMNLSYYQAWNLKEKAKDRIFGLPKNYYKLLPWMCDKICSRNPMTYIQLTHSDDGRFEQLFIAHSVSIQGFAMGCRPVIAIDSSHMSGPYRGAMFSATTYDANDCMFPLAIGVMGSENYEDWYWFLEHLKKVVGDRDIVIISDRHPALLRAVPELFGIENHAYCYRHLKENFCSFLTKQNCRGKNGKENAMRFLDSIAYARLDYDYEVALNDLRRFNPQLATWVESNHPEHWAMSKFPKKRWDKMTTNLAESINAWLKFERHHSICTFLIEHMLKLASLLDKHRKEMQRWGGLIGPKIEEKLNNNISQSLSYSITQFSEGNFGVSDGNILLHIDIINRFCTCKGWQMLGIPCQHACAVIRYIKQNVLEFVDDWYTLSKQQLILGGSFACIDTHDMPTVDSDGVVRDGNGKTFVSLQPPLCKRHPGRPKKNRIESQHQNKKQILCSRCHQTGHNRKTCNNLLVEME